MKKVLLKAPLLTQSGYGHHGRTVLRALKSREDLFDVYIQTIGWGHTSWLWENNEERRWIDENLQKTIKFIRNGGTFDLSLQVTIPNEWEKLAPINIGITAGIETTKVAPQWIEKSFLMDKIITISEHAKQSYANTTYAPQDPQFGQNEIKCQTPIDVVHYPVLEVEPENLDLDLKTKFNFLVVAQASPRKNIDKTIKCFIENFKDNKDVGLVIKTNLAKNSLIDRNNIVSTFKQVLSNYEDYKCKIYILHGYMTEKEMAGLYTHPKIKAIVSSTHGEGFGLPLFEAAYYSLPIIATDWSGHLDFLYKPTQAKNKKIKNKHMFSRVSYTLQPVQKEAVWEGVIQPDSMWAHPEEGSLKMNMLELYKDHGRFKKRSKELQKYVKENFKEETQYEQYVESIKSVCNFDTDKEIDDLFESLQEKR